MNLSDPQTRTSLAISVITIVICLIVVQSGNTTAPPAVNTSPAATKRLEAQLAGELKKREELDTRVFRLEMANRLRDTRYQSASFDPSEDGFQRIDTDLGIFAVSLQDMKPYGDGTRLTINLGNPAAASFSNVKLSLRYGPKLPNFDDPDFADKAAKAKSAEKTKEQELLKTVQGGSWNPNSITLPGVKPEELGFVEVRLSTSQVFLSK